MKRYILQVNVKKFFESITTLFIIYGWIIFNNISKLMGNEISLYKYVLISSPIFILVVFFSVKKDFNKRNLVDLYIYISIPIYLIFLDCSNSNYSHRLSYNIYMIYIFIFINLFIFFIAKNVDIILTNKILKIISCLFIIWSFIELLSNGLFRDSRFLNTNFTSFFIAQFIIIVICQKKISISDFIISIIGIIEILAASGRASLIVLTFVVFIKKFKGIKQGITYIIIGIVLFMGMKNIYYNHLKINENMVYFSRPIGFIVGDMEVVLDDSSNERLKIMHEYKDKMKESIPMSIIFGLGPKNFSEYSHNILIDSIAFGGVITFTLNITVLIRSLKYKKFNECLFYQILFFYLCMMLTGTFITNITYWGLVFLQQYKYAACKISMGKGDEVEE